MYLIFIHVTIYKHGSDCFVTTEWKRSLVLLRDSIRPHFQRIALLSPSLPVTSSQEQVLEPLSEEDDGILPIPSFDLRCKARAYWMTERNRWLADAPEQIAQSRIVHAGLDDVYRPIMYDEFREGVRQGKTTIFVPDTDIAERMRGEARDSTWRRRPKLLAYAFAFERMTVHGVRTASLSFLKGSELIRHYGPYARNAKIIQDTSHLSHEIVSADLVAHRFAALEQGRPLRLVYCGRLVPRKGIGPAIEIVAGARRQGVDVTFDIIGGGEQAEELERQVDQLGLRDHVEFLGKWKYGPELLARLADYDALLFTPPIEDTPRMIFDGYAAGLPLIGWDINYIKERSESEGATWILPLGDITGSVARLVELARDRPRLWQLTQAALQGAEYHAADHWYQRRAEWTLEAMERDFQEGRTAG